MFNENLAHEKLFYSGRFDFVVYEKPFKNQEFPLLAIEFDGKEHFDDEIVKRRDRAKKEICRKHGFELIRVENSYARRYNFIKNILIDFFCKDQVRSIINYYPAAVIAFSSSTRSPLELVFSFFASSGCLLNIL